jgi:acetyl esterase
MGGKMPIDPQIQAVMDQVAALNLPPHYEVGAVQARANAALRPRAPGPEVASVVDRSVPGPDGDVPVRVYTPEGVGPFPVLVYIHGGGMVIGTLDTSDGSCRHLCDKVGCVVVSVDYRLAPEHTFPAAPEDCYAVTKWVAENSSEIAADPSRIAVGGESAGGNLAAAVALMTRDRGGPTVLLQVLLYPMTSYDFDSASYHENAEGYSLTRTTMMWYWDQYLGSKADVTNPYAIPASSTNLKGVAPAIVLTAEFDPLRDEGEAYAKQLSAAGVNTTCTRYDGVIHGFFGMSAVVDKSKEAVNQVAAALKTAFAMTGAR